MTTDKGKPPGIDTDAKEIRFDYIKSSQFRVIHVDGVFGGMTPRTDYIGMAVWNERWPIPKQCIFELSKEGGLGKELIESRLQRDAIIREVEAHLIMTLDGAKRMREWLDEKIKGFEEKTKEKDKKE